MGNVQCADQVWVSVDTDTQTLTVLSAKGEERVRFGNISIGRGGPAMVHYRGDHTTPLGEFHIVAIYRGHRYDTFYALDYPRPIHAEQALAVGRITPATLTAIRRMVDQGRIPPSNTPLGGGIGIHGIGRGDLAIHQAFNWTNGCVALTNAQLREFDRYAAVGTRVVIR